MANLKCHQYNCAYNDCTHCTHHHLHISKHAKCDSFEQTMEDNRNGEPFLYEYADDKRFSLKADEHHIECEADSCANNEYNRCISRHIRVDCDKPCKAKCVNYRERL